MAITSKTLAHFKRCATAVLNSIDCSATVARLGFRCQIKSSRIKQLLLKTNEHKSKNRFSQLLKCILMFVSYELSLARQ